MNEVQSRGILLNAAKLLTSFQMLHHQGKVRREIRLQCGTPESISGNTRSICLKQPLLHFSTQVYENYLLSEDPDFRDDANLARYGRRSLVRNLIC